MMKTKIDKTWVAVMVLLLAEAASPFVMAQDKVKASVGADLVSNYIWRGQDLGGISIQPSLGVAYKGFSLEAWGSAGIESTDTKEFDLTIGYASNRFNVSITDYWFNKGTNYKSGNDIAHASYFHYGAYSTTHVFEAQIGYDFGWLSANWYTNVAGNDGIKENGKRAYSSYLALSTPFQLGGIDWTADLGIVPWKTTFYNGYTGSFCVSEISLTASKDIRITGSFSMPTFARISINPRTEGAYFIFGLNF